MAEVILDDSVLLRKYLLGRLDEKGQLNVESRYFVDDDFLEELQASEFDLIDAYLADNLTAKDRASFEQFFLTIPGNQDKVKNAGLLAAAAMHPPVAPAQSGWHKFLNSISALSTTSKLALGLAVLLLVALGGALIVQALRQPKAPIAKVPEKPPEQPSPQQLPPEQHIVQETPTPEGPSKKRSTVSVATLIPNLSRSGGGKQILKISAEAETVSLNLTGVTGGYQSYSASLQKAEGTEIIRFDRVKALGGRANLTFAAQKVPDGDYVVILKGTTDGQTFEPVRDYQFRASRN